MFNGTIPLIAIQMQAFMIGEALTLVFTTVVDELTRGVVDEDEDEEAAPADRGYWEGRLSKATVALADDLLGLMRKHDPSLSLRFNRPYIGIAKSGQAFNFAIFRPKRNHINVDVKLPKTPEWDEKIEQGGLDTLEYARWGAYRLRLTKEDIASKASLLEGLMKSALDRRSA